jgi:hypothetical protein
MAFAASLDGYRQYGSQENLADVGNTARAYWTATRALPQLELRALRACLFLEYRRHHFLGHPPDAASTAYIRALVEAIRSRVAVAATP